MNLTKGEAIIVEIANLEILSAESALHLGMELALRYPEYCQAVLGDLSPNLQASAHKLAENIIEQYPMEIELYPSSGAGEI